MSIHILEKLSKFDSGNDRESETAFFRTHIPWIAPLAYLNIIFKPADEDVLDDAAGKFRMPKSFRRFLSVQNGAILFSGALSVYGVHAKGQLFHRQEPFRRLPFNIQTENDDWPPEDSENLLGIGGYGFDGSIVCIDRRSSKIYLFRRTEKALLNDTALSWETLDTWLSSEIARLSVLFDPFGKRLVEESQTSPPREPFHIV